MPITTLQEALLNNTHNSISANELQKLNVQFPYCALTQILYANAQAPKTQDLLSKASLYKANPVLFARMLKDRTSNDAILDKKITENKTNNTAKPITEKSTTKLSEPSVEHNKEKLAPTIELKTEQVLPIVEPVQSSDYFAQQNIKVDNTIDTEFIKSQTKKTSPLGAEPVKESSPQDLLVTKSFNDWLQYFKLKKEQDDKEAKSKEALTAMLQHQKLTAAAGEENEVIPDAVFKQAISSISPQENLVTEALAEILLNQGKIAQAKDMYDKLSLKYPEKSAYFASKLKKVTF